VRVRAESEELRKKSQELRDWAAQIYRKSVETRLQNPVLFLRSRSPTKAG